MNQELINARFKDLATKEGVPALERFLLSQKQTECPVTHHFGPGIYIREVKVPHGTFTVGHYQNCEHMNVFLKGKVTRIYSDGRIEELKAPMLFTEGPGRKVGYVHEDMMWLNIYPTDEKDVEALEAKYLTKTVTFDEQEKINRMSHQVQFETDREDFRAALIEIGIPEEVVKEQSHNPWDGYYMPFGSFSIKIAESRIQGRGLFATRSFESGEIIAPARINGLRTIAGRYTNHAKIPNARMVKGKGKDIDLVAIKPISGCHGGYDGDEITVDYRASYKLTVGLEE